MKWIDSHFLFFKKILQRNLLIKFWTLFLIIASTSGAVFAGTAMDSLGNKVRVPDENVRIVCLSPGALECLYAIGLRDEIVGVSDYCNYPLDFVNTKPKMGGFSTPNIERIQAVLPHVVILTTVIPIQIKNQFDRIGIKLFVSEPKSLNALFESIDQLGRLFNREKESGELIGDMKNRAGNITKAIREKSIKPVRTFIEIWDNPIYAAEKNTLPGDIVKIAGGYLVPETGNEYPCLAEEKLLELNPEAIVLGHEADLNVFMERHKNVLSISAIKNRKIFDPNPDEFLRPGPRVIDALEKVAHFLHPEAF